MSNKKTILLLSDDLRMHSGIATMSREIVLGTVHKYNWIQLGAAINHPEIGKVLDISEDVKKHTDQIRKALEDAHNSIMTLRNNDGTSYTARKHADKITKILRGHIDSLK